MGDTADEINATLATERVFPYEFDIRDRAQTDELARDVFGRCQAIDVLINNSGLAVPETVEEITDADTDLCAVITPECSVGRCQSQRSIENL